MNISLPEELKQFVDQQVAKHAYGSTSEYLRELIRKQRDIEKLRAMLLEGADAGAGRPVDDALFAELRSLAENQAAA